MVGLEMILRVSSHRNDSMILFLFCDCFQDRRVVVFWSCSNSEQSTKIQVFMDLKISIILLWVEYMYNCGRPLPWQVLDKPEIILLQVRFNSSIKGSAVQSHSLHKPCNSAVLRPWPAWLLGTGHICDPRMSQFCD